MTLTKTGYVGLWTQLPGQGKEILMGHLQVDRKLFNSKATINDDVQIPNMKQTRYLNSSDKRNWPLDGSSATVNRLNLMCMTSTVLIKVLLSQCNL